MTILSYIFIALEVVLLFNLLIGVHELGHFLAANWRGLKVDRFAIWFGKPIWKKKIGGVEYALGWIPAGGYVALPQMATMEAIEGKAGGCRRRTAAERLAARQNHRGVRRAAVQFRAGGLFCLHRLGRGQAERRRRTIPRSSAGWIRTGRRGRRVCGRATRFWKWTVIR